DRARPRTRQPDVGGVDAEPIHQVQKADLVFGGRVGDRRVLKPVTERLVVELHGYRRPVEAFGRVPVVDQVLLVHDASRGPFTWTAKIAPGTFSLTPRAPERSRRMVPPGTPPPAGGRPAPARRPPGAARAPGAERTSPARCGPGTPPPDRAGSRGNRPAAG